MSVSNLSTLMPSVRRLPSELEKEVAVQRPYGVMDINQSEVDTMIIFIHSCFDQIAGSNPGASKRA